MAVIGATGFICQGRYRLGIHFPVVNEGGRSVLSVEDLAVVIAAEIEVRKHHQTCFTAAY